MSTPQQPPTGSWPEPTGTLRDRVRASDEEREQVAGVLRAAVTEGRLTLAEGDDRLAAVYAARYRDELFPMTTDLPGGGAPALWRTPRALAEARRRLRLHGAAVLAVGTVLVVAWALSGARFFWPLLPLLLLTFTWLRHARFARYLRGDLSGWRGGRGWAGGGWGGSGFRGGPGRGAPGWRDDWSGTR